MSKKKAVTYCRVSTHKQSQEGESLTQQAQECDKLAQKLNCDVIKIFTEAVSGKNIEDRKELERLLKYVRKNNVDYVLIRDIDRMTRGGSGDYTKIKNMLAKNSIKLVDTYGFIQEDKDILEDYGIDCEYDWNRVSPTSTAEKMRADMSEEERKVILRRLIPAQIKLTQEGYHIGKPNDGFVSKQIFVDGKQRYILEPDSKRGKYFYEMFEMRVNGYTDEEIVERVNKMGYRSKKRRKWNKEHTKIVGYTGGNKLDVKQLQKYICNTKYAGINIHKWTNYKPIRTKGGFLVTIDNFNIANKGKVFIKEKLDGSVDVLYNYSPTKNTKRRMKHNPKFPIKSLVCCPRCKMPFKGSSSTGKSGNKFSYYHCERNHKGERIRKDEFESKYYNLLKSIGFDKANKDALTSSLMETWSIHTKQSMSQSECIQSEIEDLESEKDNVVQKIIATENKTVMNALEKRLENIEKKIEELTTDNKQAKLNEGDINDFVKFAMQIVEHPDKMLKMTEDIEVKEVISSLYFEKIPTYSDVVNRTPEMSVVYKLCESSHSKKSLNVVRRGIEPRLPG